MAAGMKGIRRLRLDDGVAYEVLDKQTLHAGASLTKRTMEPEACFRGMIQSLQRII